MTHHHRPLPEPVTERRLLTDLSRLEAAEAPLAPFFQAVRERLANAGKDPDVEAELIVGDGARLVIAAYELDVRPNWRELELGVDAEAALLAELEALLDVERSEEQRENDLEAGG